MTQEEAVHERGLHADVGGAATVQEVFRAQRLEDMVEAGAGEPAVALLTRVAQGAGSELVDDLLVPGALGDVPRRSRPRLARACCASSGSGGGVDMWRVCVAARRRRPPHAWAAPGPPRARSPSISARLSNSHTATSMVVWSQPRASQPAREVDLKPLLAHGYVAEGHTFGDLAAWGTLLTRAEPAPRRMSTVRVVIMITQPGMVVATRNDSSSHPQHRDQIWVSWL